MVYLVVVVVVVAEVVEAFTFHSAPSAAWLTFLLVVILESILTEVWRCYCCLLIDF